VDISGDFYIVSDLVVASGVLVYLDRERVIKFLKTISVSLGIYSVEALLSL